MYASTAAFKAALIQSHKIATLVQVVAPPNAIDGSGASIAGNVLMTLKPEPGGSITIDKSQPIRRTLTFNVVDFDGTITPADMGGVLAPNGNEIKVSRGITYADGTTELIPLGVLPITQVEITDTGDNRVIQVTAKDRGWAISRRKFADVYAIAAATNVGVAIKALLTSRMAGLDPNYISFVATALTTPAMTFQPNDDPWASALVLAANAGLELYWDQDGVCRLRAEPDPVTAPLAWSYLAGATATLLGLKRTITAEGVSNHVIREGAGSGVGTPVRGSALDTNPASPTWTGGQFGDIVDYLSDPAITTAAQASSAAAAALQRGLGAAEVLVFSAIPNPAHDANDVVYVERGSVFVSSYYVVESLTMPLSPADRMEIRGRLAVNR